MAKQGEAGLLSLAITVAPAFEYRAQSRQGKAVPLRK